jgi:hypothetical protein
MLEPDLAWIAIAALFVGAALQIVLALAGYRNQRRPAEPNNELRAAQHEIHMLHAAVAALTRRLGAMEEQPPTAPVAAPAPAPRFEAPDPAYDLAGKLARKGATAEELMDTCGLSRGEVDLITRLNAAAQARTS